MGKHRRLQDAYRFAGLRPLATVRGLFGELLAREGPATAQLAVAQHRQGEGAI